MISYEKFRDEMLKHFPYKRETNDFEDWIIKEHYKTIEELKELYKMLPDGDYKGKNANWLVRVKNRIFKYLML